MPLDSLTPHDTERCKQCGADLFMVRAGDPVPVIEPTMCLAARDDSWAFCAGMRVGWTRLSYTADGETATRFQR